MSLIHPRPAYQRANTEEPETHADHGAAYSDYGLSYSSTLAYKTILPHDTKSEPSAFSQSVGKLRKVLYHYGLHGWRVGSFAAATLALLSLLINVVLISWLASHGQGAGLVEVFKGSCAKVQQIDIWTHLAINALSTFLLGGSNYCMQCLCAPTRKEVDRAHSRGKWLDIGVPSVRNLRRISGSRALLWWILGLSSVPLHLLFNSAFFKGLSTNNYDILVVSPAFVEGGGFNADGSVPNVPKVDPAEVQSALLNTNRYERLNTTACITAYGIDFLSDRRNLVLVSSNDTTSSGEVNNLLFVAQYQYETAVNAMFGKYLPFDW